MVLEIAENWKILKNNVSSYFNALYIKLRYFLTNALITVLYSTID
jgi:hypothetical protein